MPKAAVFDLKLTAMAHDGQALGRREGKVVFVPFGISGEVVRVRIVEERKRWSRGQMLRVLEPSPQRVAPPCPYFGVCGGCQWQHIDGDAQLTMKQQIVVDQLRRFGRIDDPVVHDPLGMASPWHYRNHVRFSVDETGQIGFQGARSHKVVPVDRCLLLHPLLDEMHAALDITWPELRSLSLRAGTQTGEQMVVFEARDDEVPEIAVDVPLSCVLHLGDGTALTLIGQGLFHETVLGRAFRVSARSFFQVNTTQAEAMIGVIERYLEPSTEDVLLDVYCGVGLLGLSMRPQVRRVIGIEEHPAAIRDARANAAGDSAVTLIEGPAEAVLADLDDDAVTKVIVDPPRQGCKEQVIRALLRLGPRRIVYVSCEPTTLARDAVLLAQGGYRLVEVQPVDMFPQTHHVETVSLWRRTKEVA